MVTHFGVNAGSVAAVMAAAAAVAAAAVEEKCHVECYVYL